MNKHDPSGQIEVLTGYKLNESVQYNTPTGETLLGKVSGMRVGSGGRGFAVCILCTTAEGVVFDVDLTHDAALVHRVQ